MTKIKLFKKNYFFYIKNHTFAIITNQSIIMDRLVNPFFVSGKIPPEYFCDRKWEAQQIIQHLSNQENIVLMSQRRMGKTKLVDHCCEQSELTKHYILITIDILHTTSFREFVQLFGSVVFDNIATRSSRMMKLFTATMRSLSGSFGYDPIQNTPTFDIKLGDLIRPEYTLEEIFKVIENAEKPCLIVFDEFQQITKYPEHNVEALLRSHIQRLGNAGFVFSGSQRRLMESMFFSEKRPFYMSARSIVLQPIPINDYKDFVFHHFHDHNKDIEGVAVELVYDTFQGVTLYLQRMMKDAFGVTPEGGKCDVGTIRSLIDAYIQESDPRLREQLAFVTETQKELLYAIHEENDPVKAITSAKFIKKHRLKSSSSVQSAAKKLLEYDLLTQKEGYYAIADPLMQLWLKSRRF